MQLFHLMYCSRATCPQSLASLAALHATAQKRNALTGLTGILCYGGGSFCQYLEGPPAAVSDTIARIFRDARHSDVILLDARAVPARVFPDWGMRLVHSDDLAARLLRCAFAAGADGRGGLDDADRVLEMFRSAA